MSWATAVVLIVLISAVAGVMRARRGNGGQAQRNKQDQPHLPGTREQELEREVDDLRERIKVLERIATDGNSAEARETRRIAAEIDALRDRQDK